MDSWRVLPRFEIVKKANFKQFTTLKLCYLEGSKDISGLFAPKLHAEGVRNIVVGYTLAPVATIAEIEQEVFQALKTVVEKYPHAKITLGGNKY